MTIVDFSSSLRKLDYFASQKFTVKDFHFYSQSLFPLYRLHLETEKEPVKILAAKNVRSLSMGKSECEALQKLKSAGCLVPECYGVVDMKGKFFLVMEFIEASSKRSSSFALKKLLRTLYQNTNKDFGWGKKNYIGPIEQENHWWSNFTEFWWKDRIKPQLDLAKKHSHVTSIKDRDAIKIEKTVIGCAQKWNLDKFTPRLIHGDLWSGNILVDRSNEIYLIDPCLSYANPEQDLAMLGLFGSCLSEAHKEEVAKEFGVGPNFMERNLFWQIYPLLVHVNLFGSSYLNQLRQAVRFYENIF